MTEPIKKQHLIIIFLLMILSSCTKFEIITDPYWIELNPDFKGNALGLKLHSFLNGNVLKLSISNLEGELSNMKGEIPKESSDVYLLSPLMSRKVITFARANTKSLIYYFGGPEKPAPGLEDNLVLIVRDRRRAFFNAGRILCTQLASKSILPIIYNIEDPEQNREMMSFIDGVKSIDKNIIFLYREIDSSTSETEIRNFFDANRVKNSHYVVIFSNKWRYISYELAKRDKKYIITSDSWFNKIYASNILISVEDDIKGLLKTVYKNAKMEKHGEILLEGVVLK